MKIKHRNRHRFYSEKDMLFLVKNSKKFRKGYCSCCIETYTRKISENKTYKNRKVELN